MKKHLFTALCTITALSLAACSSKGSVPVPSDQTSVSNPDGSGIWKPEKPITLIVFAGAGGGADVSCRTLASYAEKYLGQNIVIQNITGGGGSVGLNQLVSSAPDGYTIAYISPGKSNNDILLEGVAASVGDYTPIVKYASDPNILIASKSMGITNFDEFISKTQSEPEKVTIGLAGTWGNGEFLRIQLERKFDLKFKRMVYDSGILAANAVASGDCMCSGPFYTEGIAQIESDNVVPLAVTSSSRMELLPEIPTVAELTGSDFSWYVWRGIVGPKGMDEKIVAALSSAFEQACSDPEYQKKALELGINTDFQNYREFKEFFLEDHQIYREMIENESL
ncbi:tripartite tricarboxylate transporter substrate binding protein [Clostridium sp. AM58-1XD]|uniref:tripartite tricarboxylate transporter substrate binding protein n=1 Tax=Clostridium sp. AM58-1XD TaxID=2292307 RepID=UPI000E4DA3BA|nr:tripartite tricarboxylate transporter substrate binding protein [Clostridium sp. AM58-1XD]RGY97610.1 tripartite tricarboxylate transporter substrate binding protein [Clostridium sp. AM58-1XD]